MGILVFMKHRMAAAVLLVPGSLALAQGSIVRTVGASPSAAQVAVEPMTQGSGDPGSTVQPQVQQTLVPMQLDPAIADAASRTPVGAEHRPLGLKDAILLTWDSSPQDGVTPEPFKLSEQERQAIRDMLRKSQASLPPEQEDR